MKRRPDSTELPIRLEDSLFEQIMQLAERDGRTPQDVVKTAVREYIAKNTTPDERPLPPPKGG